MASVLLLVLLTFATYRVVRFITTDAFPPMVWLRRRVIWGGDRDKWPQVDVQPVRWRDGITCPHCVGVWVSAIAVTVATYFTPVELPWLVWLASAGFSSFLESLVTADD